MTQSMKWKNENFDNKVLLISSSLGEKSINANVHNAYAEHLKNQGIRFRTLELKDFRNIPILASPQQIPEEIENIYRCIKKQEYLIIFFPEHNGYFSAFFKNIIDWLSLKEIHFLKDKKVMLISASITKRDKRLMEDSIKTTLSIFKPESVEFINFKEYSPDKVSDFVKTLFN